MLPPPYTPWNQKDKASTHTHKKREKVGKKGKKRNPKAAASHFQARRRRRLFIPASVSSFFLCLRPDGLASVYISPTGRRSSSTQVSSVPEKININASCRALLQLKDRKLSPTSALSLFGSKYTIYTYLAVF